MSARTAATVGVRVIALWLILESILSVFPIFGAMPLGMHRRYQDGLSFSSADFYLHDTYYVIVHYTPMLTALLPSLLVGVLLLTFSKRVASLLIRGLPDV